MLNDDSDRMVVWRYDITISSISSIPITIPFPIPISIPNQFQIKSFQFN
jgi:hypothetical protein